MAMRPEVRRRALVVIGFCIIQWIIMNYILHNGMLNMTTNQRVLYFCISSLSAALLIFCSLIYMVIKGNDENR